MRERQKRGRRKPAVLLFGLLAAAMLSSCGAKEEEGINLAASREENEKVVNMFSPMEKTDPGVENTARSASDKTVIMAEEALGLTMAYRTYTRIPLKLLGRRGSLWIFRALRVQRISGTW